MSEVPDILNVALDFLHATHRLICSVTSIRGPGHRGESYLVAACPLLLRNLDPNKLCNSLCTGMSYRVRGLVLSIPACHWAPYISAHCTRGDEPTSYLLYEELNSLLHFMRMPSILKFQLKCILRARNDVDSRFELSIGVVYSSNEVRDWMVHPSICITTLKALGQEHTYILRPWVSRASTKLFPTLILLCY